MENSSHQQQKWIIDQAVGAAADMNNNGDYRVDLTLKLGLPDHHAQNNNPTFAGPNNQGMDQSAIVNQGAMIQAQQSFNGRHCAWPFQCDHPMASNVQIMSHPNAFNHFGGATMGFPCYGNNFAPQQLPPSPILGSAPPMNHYTLLDVPPRRASIDDGGSSASGSGGRMSYRRLRGGGNYNDPNKRCTNYNCNTNDTPMWRKGPLGPKTLCNACGIKFRKEEEKRRGKEA